MKYRFINIGEMETLLDVLAPTIGALTNPNKLQNTFKNVNKSKMYALYEPYRTAYKESLAKYPEIRERLQNLLEQGEKIIPKQWKAEIQSLQSEYDRISKEKSKTATELAYAEVISYNKKNLERELQNESRQLNRQQGRVKRGRKKFNVNFIVNTNIFLYN